MTRILLPLIASVAFASASAQPARDSLEARLSRAPGDAQAHRDLSDWLVAQGQPAAAVPHLSWLAAHAPSDVAVHRRLAQTLLWSVKEALLKGRRTGLRAGMRSVTLRDLSLARGLGEATDADGGLWRIEFRREGDVWVSLALNRNGPAL